MNDLVHGAARLLEAIHKRMLALVRGSAVVLADETSMRVQKRKKRGFVWTFTAPVFDVEGRTIRWIKVYTFSPNRSGDMPKEVLGGSTGYLVVDMYTGYNVVTKVVGRERGGCNAHARRNFFEALPTAPEAALKARTFYLQAFRVEREAQKLGIVGTKAHLELRQTKTRPIMEEFKKWLEEEQPKHLPKGPMGVAISYALNHWDDLTLFLKDPRIPFTNNLSEGNLRPVALGRKNFLHFGNDAAGRNFAILYSIVMSCVANGVNPLEYLKDVLIRIHTHPASRIDELLPHNWRPVGDKDGGPAGGGDPSGCTEAPARDAETSADLASEPKGVPGPTLVDELPALSTASTEPGNLPPQVDEPASNASAPTEPREAKAQVDEHSSNASASTGPREARYPDVNPTCQTSTCSGPLTALALVVALGLVMQFQLHKYGRRGAARYPPAGASRAPATVASRRRGEARARDGPRRIQITPAAQASWPLAVRAHRPQALTALLGRGGADTAQGTGQATRDRRPGRHNTGFTS